MAKSTDFTNVNSILNRVQEDSAMAFISVNRADKEKGIEGQQNSSKSSAEPNKIVIAGKPPKPKRDRQLNVQIDAEHLEKIKKYAKSKGLSVAELLEQLIDML